MFLVCCRGETWPKSRILKWFFLHGVAFAGVGDEEITADVQWCAVSHRLTRLMLQSPFQLTKGSCTV